MPAWALDHVDRIARETVDNLVASGVRIVGNVEQLTERVPARGPDAPAGPVPIPPAIAASMTMGVLVATGAARNAGKVFGRFEAAEPVELIRVPTYQVLGDGPVLQVFFTDDRPLRNHRDLLRADKTKAVAFGHELIRRGVYCAPGGKLYLSLAHSDGDIDRTIGIAAEALRAIC